MTQAAGVVRSPWIGLTFVLSGFVIRLMNATITSSELPAFEAEFNVPGSTAELSLTLFLAVAGALIAPVGMLADRYGRIRVFTYGAIGMIIANTISALAPNFAVFMASRVLEAVAFPAMGAASLALVAGAFTDQRQRARAFAAYGACYGIALALANVLGGYFVQDASWRWSFAMNVPVLIIVLIGVRATLKHENDPHPQRQFDAVGAAILLVGISALLVGLDRGPVGGWYGASGVLMVVAAISFVGLFQWENHRVRSGHQVIFDPELFRAAGFRAACAVSALMMFGAFSVLTVMPLYWQIVGERTPLAVGLGLAPMGVGWALGAVASAPLGRRLGARLTIIMGLVVAAVSMMGLALAITDAASVTTTIVPLTAVGVGLGLVYGRINEAGMRHVSDTQTGLGVGVLIGVRFIAAGLGGVILAQGLMLSATFDAQKAITDDGSLSQQQQTELLDAVSAAARGRYGPLSVVETSPTLDTGSGQIRDAYASGTRFTLFAGAAVLVLGAFAGRWLPSEPGSRRGSRRRHGSRSRDSS